MQSKIWPTIKGDVYIEGPVAPEYIDTLTMNEHLRSFRPPEQQKEALKKIAAMSEGMIFIARHEKEIVGYITFHRPDDFTRWYHHPKIIEMGGIEISKNWRRMGIAEELLRLGFATPWLEDYIVITTEYCWHWDLKETGLEIWAYQRMLCKLFAKVGMERYTTDDPEILEHPANVLMARIGRNVSPKDIILFEELRFQRTRKPLAMVV